MAIIMEGVLRMPYEMAMSSELSRLQFHSMAQEALEELQRLRAENEAMKRDADRYRWIVANSNRGAQSNGQTLNVNLLNGHRHKNRMMWSFIIRADNSGESVDLPLDEAIDRAMKG